MVNPRPNTVRCVNTKNNKVRYFSKELANDAIWRKHTGFEIQELPKQPIAAITEPEVKQIQEQIKKAVTAPIPAKPKRKYTKKQAQPA